MIKGLSYPKAYRMYAQSKVRLDYPLFFCPLSKKNLTKILNKVSAASRKKRKEQKLLTKENIKQKDLTRGLVAQVVRALH